MVGISWMSRVRFRGLRWPSEAMSEVDVGDRLLWPEEVAEVLGVPVGTLANWRYQRRGPAFVKVGRHVRYRRRDVDSWVERHVVGGRR